MAMKFEDLLKRIDAGSREKYLRELLQDREVRDLPSGGSREVKGLESRFVAQLSDVEAQDSLIEALGEKVRAATGALKELLEQSLTEAIFHAEQRRSMLEAMAAELTRIKDRLDAIKAAGTG